MECVIKSNQRKRIIWLDVARCFAIISISLNHAAIRAYNLDDCLAVFSAESTASTVFAAVIYVISKIGVPVFLMISGALLLDKRIETADDVLAFYKNNLLRIFITTEIWLIIMFLCLNLPNIMSISQISDIGELAAGLAMTMCFVNQTTFGSMWYMPMIMCIYLLIPMIAMIIKRIPFKIVAIPSAIVFFSAFVVPGINDFCTLIGSKISLKLELNAGNLFSMYLLYVFAGYYIRKSKFERLSNASVVIFTSICFMGCAAYQLWCFMNGAGHLIDYNSVMLFLTSLGVFELFRRYCDREMLFTPQITYISKISFGIFFAHICIMTSFKYISQLGIMPSSRPVNLLIFEVVSLIGSILLIKILSKSKVCSNYLFLIKE